MCLKQDKSHCIVTKKKVLDRSRIYGDIYPVKLIDNEQNRKFAEELTRCVFYPSRLLTFTCKLLMLDDERICSYSRSCEARNLLRTVLKAQ
jgi:hypothetical protein